jgi:hypothetical protein
VVPFSPIWKSIRLDKKHGKDKEVSGTNHERLQEIEGIGLGRETEVWFEKAESLSTE